MRVAGSPMMLRVLPLGVALSIALACRAPANPPGMSRQEYIDVYVEMLRASGAARDSAAAAEARGSILRAHGLKPEDLEEFVHQHANDPQYLASVWSEIESALRADTAVGAREERREKG